MMFDDSQSGQIITILFFAVSFTVIGWFAPALYAAHAPADQFIEVHNFEAENTTVDAGYHSLCFDRTVHQANTGTIFVELYLLDDTGGREKIDSKTIDRYFQRGSFEVEMTTPLPQRIQPGDYRYLIVIQMDMADGRVERNFKYTSDTFTVAESGASAGENFTCS